MDVDLCVLYRLLRTVAVAKHTITYGELSDQYEHQTGERPDPHRDWNSPLARIDRRCEGLCHGDHRPVLSAIVVSQGTRTPGPGFWGIENHHGGLVTPAVASDEAWLQMVKSVYAQEWPEAFDDLPA